jgi:hypothetical protein
VTEYGKRTRRLPAPPHIVWQDLVHPATTGPRVWLDLRDDEVTPRVVESEAPGRVVWSSLWPHRPEDRVVLELAPAGSDTALTFTLFAVGDDGPDESTTGHIRHRVNHLLFADLRFSYGQ